MATPGKPRQSGIPAPGRTSSIPTPGRPRSASSIYQNPPSSLDSNNEMSRAFADAIRANDPAQHRLNTALSTSSSSLSPKSASVAPSGRRSVVGVGRPSSVASSSSALSASTRAGARTPLSTRPSSRAQSRQSDLNTVSSKSRTFEVGDNVRIESLGFEGVLRYLGDIEGKPGQWAGVQLSGGFVGKGKNNGSVGGIQYFRCPENCGVFVAFSKLSAATVGPGVRPPSVASSRNGRATPAMTGGRVTPSFSGSFSTSRTPSASYSSGRITPATGRATPSASTARIPAVKTPSYKPRVPTVKTPVSLSLSEKITVGSRASKYMSMTAKDLPSRDGSKPFAPSSPIPPATSPRTSRMVVSPTRAPGSPFATPKPLTTSKLASFGKGRPSGTPRQRLPSGQAMPPPASPFSKAQSLQEEDLPDDNDGHSEGPIFTGKLTYSRPGSSASFRSGTAEDTSLLSRLQSRLDALEYENERLRISAATHAEPAPPEDNGELERLKTVHQETLAQVLQLQEELADSRNQFSKQEGQIISLQENLEQAGKDMEEQKQNDAEMLLILNGELETATKEVEQLEQLCKEKEEQIANIGNDLSAKESEIETLKSVLESTIREQEEAKEELGIQIDELRVAGQETIALYEERMSILEGQRYDLQSRLDSFLEKASNQVQSPILNKTEANLSATEIDNETLREQVQHLQKKISMMEEIIEDSRANTERLEDTVLERVKRLKEKEEGMKKELAEGQKEVERMSRSETSARNRVDEIEEALRESTIALENARAETEILRSELADLDNLVEGAGDGDISTRVVEYTRRIASEREKNEKEITQLRQLLQEQEASVSGKDAHNLLEEISRLRSLNDDLDEELARARSELEDKDRDIRELKKKMRDLPVVNGTLDTSKGLSPSSSKDGVKEELAGMKHIVQELQKENSLALQRIKLLESENNILKSEAEQLRQEVAILEENLDQSLVNEESGTGNPIMSDDVVSLQRKLRDQSMQLEQLRKKLSETDTKHARNVHDLNKEISEMEALVESKIYREDELEQEIERLKEKVARYKKSTKTPGESSEAQRLSIASTSSGTSEGVCEICERPGHDIFNCGLLKGDVGGPPTSVESYCEDCETYGHLPADCPHSQDVF